jgi:hypothetical protein
MPRQSSNLRGIIIGVFSKAAMERVPSQSASMPQETWHLRRFATGLRFCPRTVRKSPAASFAHVLISFSVHRYSCPNPAQPTWCGDLRDSQGRLILDASGNVQSQCVAVSSSSSCPSLPKFTAKAVPKVYSIVGDVSVSLTAQSNDNATVLATLNIPANSVTDVTFVISSVADSVFQAGSFAALFSSGKLRSPLISITPNSIVDARLGSITLALPVNVPSSQCSSALSTMQARVFIFSAHPALADFVTPFFVGVCSFRSQCE